jgi:hypothetical protein
VATTVASQAARPKGDPWDPYLSPALPAFPMRFWDSNLPLLPGRATLHRVKVPTTSHKSRVKEPHFFE